MCVFEVSTHVSCMMVCVRALVHEGRMVVCVCAMRNNLDVLYRFYSCVNKCVQQWVRACIR
jgi:hypothetical protein